MSETIRLDLPILLPDVRTARDRCIERLLAEVGARPGVERAHLVDTGDAAQLCLHYDPGQLPLERVRELCATAGARLTDRYGHVDAADGGIRHARRARTVEQVLARMPGVVDASATVAGPVHVEFDRQQTDARRITAALASLGVAAAEVRPDAHRHDHSHEAGHHHGSSSARTELWCAAGAGAALAAGFLVEKLLPGTPVAVPLVCYLVAYLAGGWFTALDAAVALRHGRFEIDTLMLVAAVGAAALGQWPEGALLLFLFSLGHALEHAAMGRANAEIRALARLAPERALRIEDGGTTDVAVDTLRVGDELLVRPGDRLAADGFVVAGASVVDQSAVTGESAGIEKSAVPDIVAAAARPGDIPSAHLLFAGSLNGPSTLEMMVTRTSDDSLLARAARMAAGAEAYKGRSQRFAERFERWFVPAVLLLVFVLLFAFLVVDEPFSASFYRAMAVLVAASPCALAISTPSAILSGVARAARAGLLVKGGSALEALGEVKTVAFDKTGTLTPGRPQLTDLVAADGVDEATLLAAAAAAEQQLGHPLARAVTAAARARLGPAFPPPAAAIENLPGLGVAAAMDGAPLLIGSEALLEAHGSAPAPALAARAAALRNAGRTVMFVHHAGRDLGLVALMDEARPEAPAVLAALRGLGITRLVMLSGDSQAVAAAIATALGLSEVRGGLLPDDKVGAILALRAEAPVAMVGDGINDGPALASANVGIAMGAAGSDVALEAADVALMGDRLDALPFAVLLGRATRRTIRQNLAISLGMVAVLVPLTILGLRIGPAVAAHEGSTLLVVLNGLRLLRLRAPALASAAGSS